MLAKISDCPLLDTEHLSSCADRGMEQLKPVIQERLKNIKHAGLSQQATELEYAFLAAINHIQNETIRSTICIYCDTDRMCHPERYA
jgi:hypothetical protein